MTSMYLFPVVVILLLSPTYMARPQNVNIAQSGNTRISTIDGVFTCDKIICPSNSTKCSVSRKSTADLLNIQTVRTCYDFNGVIAKEENFTDPNPHPGTQVSDYSEASRTGSHVIQHFQHGNVDPAIAANFNELNKKMQEWQERQEIFHQQMTEFNTNWHNEFMQSIQKSVQQSIQQSVQHSAQHSAQQSVQQSIQKSLESSIPKYQSQWN